MKQLGLPLREYTPDISRNSLLFSSAILNAAIAVNAREQGRDCDLSNAIAVLDIIRSKQRVWYEELEKSNGSVASFDFADLTTYALAHYTIPDMFGFGNTGTYYKCMEATTEMILDSIGDLSRASQTQLEFTKKFLTSFAHGYHQTRVDFERLERR